MLVKDANGKPSSMALRDVRTGQFLQCLDSGDDLRVPTTPTWCEVINWGQAEVGLNPHVRIRFDKPSGGQGSLTVTPTHLIYKLTAATLGAQAASIDACKLGWFACCRGCYLRLGRGRQVRCGRPQAAARGQQGIKSAWPRNAMALGVHKGATAGARQGVAL